MSLHAILASLRRLRAQVVKELLCVLRDPKSRVVLIVPPLVQLFIFSFAATLEVKNIDIALLNRRGDPDELTPERLLQHLGAKALRLGELIVAKHDEQQRATFRPQRHQCAAASGAAPGSAAG